MRPFLYSLFIVTCLSLPLLGRPVNTTAEGTKTGTAGGTAMTMPKQCRTGKTSTEALNWRWKQGTVVRVYYLKDNFSRAETEALARAVNNWNEALKEIDSLVAFIINGESDGVARDGTSITVMRGIPSKKERVGEIKLHSRANGRTQLVVTISPAITEMNALTSLLTHELGHTLGLADCYGCKRGTTGMAAFKDKKGNDVYAPSECDKYVVAAGYMRQQSVAQALAAPMQQE